MHFLKNYFRNTKSYSSLRFIFELSFVAILGKLLIGFLIGIIFVALDLKTNHLPASDYQEIADLTTLFLLLCVIAPILETIIAQWLPITLLKKFISNINLIIGIDALLFTLAHYWIYGFFYIPVILPSALVLAWSFYLYRKKSFSKAFWITSAIHGLHNFTAFLPIAFL